MSIRFTPLHLAMILLSPVFPPLLLVALAMMIRVNPPELSERLEPLPEGWWEQ